ncbi:MAG: DUF3341 domain-containing protein [Bdellovibrionota bacterium]
MRSAKNVERLCGVVGYFSDPETLLKVMPRIRDFNFCDFDAYSPYPIHGLDSAQGLKRSPIPYITFVAGLTGATLAFIFQYWTSVVDWPLNVGGKPLNSWPAFVPIIFEVTILFAGLTTFAAMLLFNGLPDFKRKRIDPAVTRDKFAIFISAPRSASEEKLSAEKGFRSFNEKEVKNIFSSLGAMEIKNIYEDGRG